MTDKKFKIVLITSLGSLLIGFLLWSNRSYTITRTVFAMGTVFEITATGKTPEVAVKDAIKTIRHIEDLTGYARNSDIQKINRLAGNGETQISDETLEILQIVASHYHALSGAFDPTVAPLIELWGFGANGEPHLPKASQVSKVKKLINFENVRINPSQKRISLANPGMRLDLGGIAKGYAVDRAYQTLQKHNIKSALINGGSSSIRIIGKKAPLTGWKIGIGHPRRTGKLLGTLKLPKDRALGTSADTQNFFIQNGIRYSHLINPKTGYPAQDKILVTVTAPTAAEADLLSTAFFILPLSKIKDYIQTHPEVGAIIYDSAKKLTVINEPHFSK